MNIFYFAVEIETIWFIQNEANENKRSFVVFPIWNGILVFFWQLLYAICICILF